MKQICEWTGLVCELIDLICEHKANECREYLGNHKKPGQISYFKG